MSPANATARAASARARRRVTTSLRISSVTTNRARRFFRANRVAASWCSSLVRTSASSALVSARSFTIALLRPSVEIVVVIRGFVSCRRRDGADPGVHGVRAEFRSLGLLGASEVSIDGFPNHGRQARASTRRLVLEFPVRFLGKTEVRRDIPSHRDITISQEPEEVDTTGAIWWRGGRRSSSGRRRWAPRTLGRAARPAPARLPPSRPSPVGPRLRTDQAVDSRKAASAGTAGGNLRRLRRHEIPQDPYPSALPPAPVGLLGCNRPFRGRRLGSFPSPWEETWGRSPRWDLLQRPLALFRSRRAAAQNVSQAE